MEAAIKKPERFQPKDIIAICLVAFTALVLFPLAPKLGRGLTAVVLILMFAFLWYPTWHFAGWVTRKIGWNRRLCFAVAIATVIILHILFGVYVWPPIQRHLLTALERTSFENALRTQKGDDIEIQIACSPNDEKTCTYAANHIS
jgi:predicted PurR-regulated permease PerM